ncbi:MAG: dCTP deaminase [Methylophaga sp.]|nr:dCTP deaminase [Methylophaga sp.]
MIINGKKLLEAAPIKNMLGFKDSFSGASHGLSEAGYDIRIAEDIMFMPSKKVTIVMGADETLIESNNFVLASAYEEFQMPNNLVGIVHDKSTWARQGLSVFNTVIEPGWSGHLTLELVYHGSKDLHIKAGQGIAQVIFHETVCMSSYDGKYQNQKSGPQPAITK